MLENKKEEKFAEWYIELVEKAELMDYSPVQGSMIIRPRAYAIWQAVQDVLNAKMKADGVENAYFPIFIPENLLKKEAEHFEGFSPEVAWVTHGGNEQLGERLALRPTSETIMYVQFSKWIRSHRDLPLKINQWCNIIRWDTKALKPFLRTREFLWQEGHTAHATKEEAEEMVLKALDWYRVLCEEYLCIPVLLGKKGKNETFPGADYTTTIETLMPDGKALQAGTSHLLGQNFAKMFDIKFKDARSEEQFAWQTSWGVSTRLIGALAMMHSDNKGLVLPPKVASLQVVIVPITGGGDDSAMVLQAAGRMEKTLMDAGITVKTDNRDDKTPGFKYNYWEARGVPLRLEIGFRELAQRGATAARRDTGEKDFVSEEKIVQICEGLLEQIQENLFNKAKSFVKANIHTARDFTDFKAILDERKGFVMSPWCGDPRCEEAIKEETSATIRLIPFNDEPHGKCVMCGRDALHTAFFARSY
ncbi:proline--tRNA ligase [Candidatus Micrarchaeota archaeon]|nr:proline--tRNA ligase [Candidatus Micrarchaeota archaeon]